jgi:hypothetical protein
MIIETIAVAGCLTVAGAPAAKVARAHIQTVRTEQEQRTAELGANLRCKMAVKPDHDFDALLEAAQAALDGRKD